MEGSNSLSTEEQHAGTSKSDKDTNAVEVTAFIANADEKEAASFRISSSDSTNVSKPVKLEEHVPDSHVIRDIMPKATLAVGDDFEPPLRHTWSNLCRTMTKTQTDVKLQKVEAENLPRHVRSYYKRMDEILVEYAEIEKSSYSSAENTAETLEQKRKALDRKTAILAKASFFLNLALLILKAVASGVSGSLSVISSLVDSIMDLVSGIIIWITSSAMKKRLPYSYPSGRTRLEPVAIMILSAVMSVASVQLVAESIQTIASLARGEDLGIDFDNLTIGVLGATMLSKAVAWILCRSSPSPSVQALALDHRNDVLANMIAAICGYVGFRWWPYLDSIGAILISLYIFANWWKTGTEQIKLLTGFTADPQFLSKVTWVSLQHNAKIKQIDTVRAYHFGNNFIVEVHIVLPGDMSLKEAHDIGEPLQIKLESMEKVERAFVHIDYESEHNPADEHIIR